MKYLRQKNKEIVLATQRLRFIRVSEQERFYKGGSEGRFLSVIQKYKKV